MCFPCLSSQYSLENEELLLLPSLVHICFPPELYAFLPPLYHRTNKKGKNQRKVQLLTTAFRFPTISRKLKPSWHKSLESLPRIIFRTDTFQVGITVVSVAFQWILFFEGIIQVQVLIVKITGFCIGDGLFKQGLCGRGDGRIVFRLGVLDCEIKPWRSSKKWLKSVIWLAFSFGAAEGGQREG